MEYQAKNFPLNPSLGEGDSVAVLGGEDGRQHQREQTRARREHLNQRYKKIIDLDLKD